MEAISVEEFHRRNKHPRTREKTIESSESCIWICPDPYGDSRVTTHYTIWLKDDGRDIESNIEIVDFGCGLSQEAAVDAVQSMAHRRGIDKIVIDLAPIRT